MSQPTEDGGKLVPALTALLLVAAVFMAIAFGYKLSGDALIHLVFMENAAGGHWYRFNRDLVDASSTSMLWTAFGALLWKAGGPALTFVGMKGLGFASLALNGWLVFAILRAIGTERRLAAVVTLMSVAIPSTLTQSVQGMENAPFASLILGALYSFVHQVRAGPISHGRTALTFALLGLAGALRPEGLVACGAFGIVWLLHVARREGRGAVALAATAVLSATVCFAPFWLHYLSVTHQLIPSSGVSRVMMARRDTYSLHVGPLWIYGRALAYLFAYAPLPILALLGMREAARAGRDPLERSVVAAVASVLAAGLFLYVFVTGAVHASRYLIWTFSLLCIPAAIGAGTLARDRARARRAALAAACLWMVSVIAADGFLRGRHGAFGRDWGYSLAELGAAPARRAATTDDLLATICSRGCCDGQALPAVALIEVQLRYFLDDRVRIVATDGVTKGPFAKTAVFDALGCPDLDAIDRDRSVVALLDDPLGSVHLESCAISAWAHRIHEGWSGEDLDIPGWTWRRQPYRMLVRDCETGVENAHLDAGS